MEMSTAAASILAGGEGDQVRVRRETLQEVLEQCQRALEMLKNAGVDPDPPAADAEGDADAEDDGVDEFPPCSQSEADELCDLLKSKVESPDFLEKLGSMHMSVSHNPGYLNVVADESSSWDMVNATDLWEDTHTSIENESEQGGYVLVKQEDIVDGIACFMAAYLLSLKETKELTPNQLQEALSKTFSVKTKKGKLRKAWDGSKVVYNVASWGATAIGIYQNPALYRAASVAFWTSCRVISKLL